MLCSLCCTGGRTQKWTAIRGKLPILSLRMQNVYTLVDLFCVCGTSTLSFQASKSSWWKFRNSPTAETAMYRSWSMNVFSHCELRVKCYTYLTGAQWQENILQLNLAKLVSTTVSLGTECIVPQVQLAGNFGTETRTVLSVDGKLTSYSLGLSMSFKGLNL